MNPYNDTRDDIAKTWGRAHGNGEQTHVAILTAGENRYAAIAYDVDPADFTPIAAECIAYDPTLEGVTTKADAWMEQNPKGVAPEGGGSGSSKGFLSSMVAKILEFGEQRAEKLEQQGEKQ